jgi:hypothetical protein
MAYITDKTKLLYVFCDTSTVTIPRIRILMEASIKQDPFSSLYFKKVEIFTEHTKISERIRGISSTSYVTDLDSDTKYILTYIDGQLVEVNDLKAEKIVFRNLREHIFIYGRRDYKEISEYWWDIDIIIDRTEETGELIWFSKEVIDYINSRPDELINYQIDGEGFMIYPASVSLEDHRTQAEYESILRRAKRPIAPNVPAHH